MASAGTNCAEVCKNRASDFVASGGEGDDLWVVMWRVRVVGLRLELRPAHGSANEVSSNGADVSRSDAIDEFVQSGNFPDDLTPWDGDVAACHRTLRGVLSRIVAWRANRAPLGDRVRPVQVSATLEARVWPLVSGLLSEAEARAVLSALRDRLHVVDASSLPTVLSRLSLEDGWALANIVLEDMGAPPLSDWAPQLDGLCVDGHVYVGQGALRAPTDRIDVLVHEVAHLLHSLSRSCVGLTGDEVLVPIPEDQHETFAYACELWSCHLAGVRGLWVDGADNVSQETFLADARVDAHRLAAALRAAADGGWGALLAAILAPPVPVDRHIK